MSGIIVFYVIWRNFEKSSTPYNLFLCFDVVFFIHCSYNLALADSFSIALHPLDQMLVLLVNACCSISSSKVAS